MDWDTEEGGLEWGRRCAGLVVIFCLGCWLLWVRWRLGSLRRGDHLQRWKMMARHTDGYRGQDI